MAGLYNKGQDFIILIISDVTFKNHTIIKSPLARKSTIFFSAFLIISITQFTLVGQIKT